MNATGVRGDVPNAQDLEHLFTQIRDEKGSLDILVANAGIARYAALGNIAEELYQFSTSKACYSHYGRRFP